MPIPHPVALEQDDWFELTVGLWIFRLALERLWDGFDYSYEKSVSYGKPEGPPVGCSPFPGKQDSLKLTIQEVQAQAPSWTPMGGASTF